jgi:hypothetical protein
MSYDVFRQAIISKQQVTCNYAGHYREVCPHVIGTKNGRQQVLVYQFGGGSSSGLPPGGEWRCLVVPQVSNAAARPGPWHTGTSHTKPQTCVDRIDVEIG